MRSESWRVEQRDDFTLSELLNALWGKWPLVASVTLAFLLPAIFFGLFRPYVAEADIYVRPEGRPGADEDPEAFTREVGDVALTPNLSRDATLSRDAARRAGWTAGAEDFNERLGTEIDPNDGHILVSFRAETPEDASRAANAFAQVFVERVRELSERRPVGGTLAAEVGIAREATPPEGRFVEALLYGAAAGALGLVAGGAAALFLDSRTRRWRGAKDAELTLRAPVLGEIPDYHYHAEKKSVG